MNWVPKTRTGIWVGVGIVAAIVLIDVGLVWRIVSGPPNGWTFVSALLVLASLFALALVGYRIYDLSRLSYAFDRNRLVIQTAGAQQIVPTCNIERVIDGRETALSVRMKAPIWPGCTLGQGLVEGVGLTLFYAVDPPARQAIVVTPALAYGISVDDMESFLAVLTTCQELGPSVEVEQRSERASFVRWAFWRDRLAQSVLGAGVLLNVLLFSLLLFRYPHLPDVLPMHYDAAGTVDRISPRDSVFLLPTIAVITLCANDLAGVVLYRRQRVVAYLLWSGAALVQVFLLIALWQIVT
ncbi:MAG: DUF1648 domain-containing protein [Anaerolineae bacterium]|nr:DUF1648 domain-containing protein [Anaerolineae bacterium]